MELEVFGKVDRDEKGKVKSDYPAFCFPQHKEELEESIRYKQSQLDKGLIIKSEEGFAREALSKEKTRLKEIDNSITRYSQKEIDYLAVCRKSLGKKVQDLMPRQSQIERKLANAHEEANKISEPCLKLDPEEVDFIKACDQSITNDGKISRGQAEKCWKIASRIIGEPSNIEELRRP